MKKVVIVVLFTLLLVGCRKEQPVMHEGVFQYQDIKGKVCTFISVSDGASVQFKCTPEQVKNIRTEDPVRLVFSQTSKETKLETVSGPLVKVEKQASWGEGCDFYFPMEDLWHELQCTEAQRAQLTELGRGALSVIYYASPDDKFYLASTAVYTSEFTTQMLYTGGDRTDICSFYNPKRKTDVPLSCTRTQRAALDRYYKNASLKVTYTDAGGYRLLDYEAPEELDVSAPITAEEYFDTDDYEMSFEVMSTTGRFIPESSNEELCVFTISGKTLKLACTENDYTQLKADPGLYDIYYTAEEVLFGYEKLD